ncbi:MAG TPA: carbon-nitrogen hydrolase family protein [Vicinamibacterales bacterium]|nr:carbon-nitrogen hydrolase family protein [Vicinamibacterales bacterium]
MATGTLSVALISDVFHEADAAERLRARLAEAAARGAALAVLPELPLNPWAPATATARDEDAEAPGGPRHQRLAEAARAAGIGLVGGAIVRDPGTGRRYNTALVFDASGTLRAACRKLHIPEEPGFWETSHYEGGTEMPSMIDAFGVPVGVQICSDINRPEGSHLLGGLGAEAILAPRATERATYDRWRVVFVANALTSAAYVLSVNRPAPEQDVLLGGPSIAVAPDGDVLVETTEPVALVTLERARAARARRAYPGYLPVRADLYAEGWRRLAHGRQAQPAR